MKPGAFIPKTVTEMDRWSDAGRLFRIVHGAGGYHLERENADASGWERMEPLNGRVVRRCLELRANAIQP
ncbi:MAG: hypothetical protein ABI639_08535 [Thermoanaerobaculia bacterium]